MATQQEKIKKVVGILREVTGEVSALLIDSPGLQTRAEHVLNQLSNVLSHAGGIASDTESGPAVEVPHTSIFGKKIPMNVPAPIAAATPTTTEADELKEFAQLAFDEFDTSDAKDMLGTYNDLVIRAVARMAGLTDVTPTNPSVIDLEYVKLVQGMVAKVKGTEAPAEIKEVITAEVVNKEPAPVITEETPAPIAAATPTDIVPEIVATTEASKEVKTPPAKKK